MVKYNPCNIQDRIALATALQDLLISRGFVKIESKGEDIYSYVFPLSERTKILVYTTIVNGAVRGDGADAIRVAGVYQRKDGQHRGIVSDTRINRTGDIDGIVERTRQRMRSTYAALRTNKTCNKCGAPMFISKNKNEVCSETCWIK